MPSDGENGEPNDSGEQDGNPNRGDRVEETDKPFVIGGEEDEAVTKKGEVPDEITQSSLEPAEPTDPVGPETPGPEGGDDGGGASGPIDWVLRGDGAGATFFREFVGSALVVVLIGLLLFAISGVWPPMVAVESGSMEPRMERGDLVFVMDDDRFEPDVSIGETGIATYRSSLESGYKKFGTYGDVIIYRQDGSQRSTPIIHRARFWVNESENWYTKANESFLDGNSCESIANCPAPHDGFVTKGDNNNRYDQVSGISSPVKPGWIKGTAELRIPWLGHVRLELSKLSISPTTGGPSSEGFSRRVTVAEPGLHERLWILDVREPGV